MTFRLADSLPQTFWAAIEDERLLWLRQQGIDPNLADWKAAFLKLPHSQQSEYVRQAAVHLNKGLDLGYGACLLKHPQFSKLVSDALFFFQGERVWIGDWVVMPNHIHALMTPIGDFELEAVLKSVKRHTARQINCETGQEGQFWSRESYDHIDRNAEQLERVQRYIGDNPAKAGIGEGEFRTNREECRYEVLR